MHCRLPCIAKHVLYSCLRTLKYCTFAHLSFRNTIQTLRILKPLCQPVPGTAAATRACSQITLGKLVHWSSQLPYLEVGRHDASMPSLMGPIRHYVISLLMLIIYTVSQKTVQNCFCQNFVKFPPILIIFGRKMVKRLNYARCTHFPPHLIRVTTLPC